MVNDDEMTNNRSLFNRCHVAFLFTTCKYIDVVLQAVHSAIETMYIGQKCPFVLSCHARKLFFFISIRFLIKKSQKLYDANQINNVQCVCVCIVK